MGNEKYQMENGKSSVSGPAIAFVTFNSSRKA
jgi:hypothetical protein